MTKIVIDGAVALLALGAFIAIFLNSPRSTIFALALVELGSTGAILARFGLAVGLIQLVIGAGVVGILWWTIAPLRTDNLRGYLQIRGRQLGRLQFHGHSHDAGTSDSAEPTFRLTIGAMALIGAYELAAVRPLVGARAIDLAWYLPVLAGLAVCLIGRAVPRLMLGLLLVIAGVHVLIVAAGGGSFLAGELVFAIAEITLAIGFAHLVVLDRQTRGQMP